MNDASNLVTIVQSIPQWGWATIAAVLFGLLLKLVWSPMLDVYSGYKDIRAYCKIAKEGSKVPNSDPERHVGLVELKADVLGNREIATSVTGKLIDKCAGMKCPLHSAIIDELREFSAKAEISRAETKLLVQGIADDVRVINEHTFPLIAEIVNLVKNGSSTKGK